MNTNFLHNVGCATADITLLFILFIRAYIDPRVAPCDINITYKRPMSAEVSWTPIPIGERNGFILGYVVRVYSDSTIAQEILVVGEDANSIGIRNLNPKTSYTYEISAKTKAGFGPASSITSNYSQGETVYLNCYFPLMHAVPTLLILYFSPLTYSFLN